MRYCVSSISGTTPECSSRSNIESLRPRLAASSQMTVGRSCLWSPTSTSERQLCVSGTRHEGSVDCAVSSISTYSKAIFDNESAPEPTHVASTTSAPAAAAATPPSASAMYGCMSARTASCRPSRTTLTPPAASAEPMLSTATLESAQQSTGRTPSARTHSVIRCTATVVLPVPGGPCTSVSRRSRLASMAACCDALRPSADSCSFAWLRASAVAMPTGAADSMRTSSSSCAPSRPPMPAINRWKMGVAIEPFLLR
mmetsp:Transcript_58620/g.134494  ORF Transcript_58620/g.134494 Transcript_58620/m.134494 type:complete len:256 (-) Transcript_58620:537-1304(-)